MKHRVLSCAVAAVLGVGAEAAPATAKSPDEWGQAAAHATGDSFNPGESRLTPALAAELAPRWTVPMHTVKCAEPSVPLVGARRLITAEGYRISGYDAGTGALKWRTPVDGNRDIDLAAVVGGTLIAQYRKCTSGKAYLIALDARTGKTRYTRQIAAPMYGLLADRGILVGGAWDATISKYVLRGYRIADGAPVWSRVGSVHGATVSARGRMVVFGDDGPATAIDITTGKTAWPAGNGCFTPIGASTDGARFYVRCDPDDRIRTVDALTGKVLGTFPDHGATFGFATDGKRVYLHTFSDDGVLAVDAKTGKKAWRASFADHGPIEFTLGGGVVYGWRGDGRPLAAFATGTGSPIKLTTKTAALQGAPVVAHGRLYGRTGATLTSFAP
ncbi:outer membrane protein assembly factor BamB family protein [Jidongwangia harbinensis]|uniref:outer membrane protein assembly factor BamB family protein n=1 Tax=Jidongwangia harbinensis TaxID=2878561 RepID=UPI001CD9F13A|nr:PQQ-binding-like beta-propeller repeat protein [Jidongwangia harbinensis]MCA2211289.1 PQQ-binding-like beta-propeller repeat protein [Jidongwangia harbinensis]